MDNIQQEEKVTEEKVTIEAVKPQTVEEKPSENWKYNPEYHRTSEFLGLDKFARDDYETAKRVAFLVDWAKEQNKSYDYLKAIVKIDELRRELGVTYQGKLLINAMYQQVRLMLDRDQFEKSDLLEKEKNIAREIAEEKLKIRLKMQNIKPEVDEKDIEEKVKASMHELNKQIKRKVKSQITQTVNKGIKEALQKAVGG